jgi:uncharacterized membrane protein YedE/YeeE
MSSKGSRSGCPGKEVNMGVKRQTLTIAVIFAVILWAAAVYIVVFGIPKVKTSKASTITITNEIEKMEAKKSNRLTPD